MCHQALFRVPREGLGTRLSIHIHVQAALAALATRATMVTAVLRNEVYRDIELG